jgi:hypothetical protein
MLKIHHSNSLALGNGFYVAPGNSGFMVGRAFSNILGINVLIVQNRIT